LRGNPFEEILTCETNVKFEAKICIAGKRKRKSVKISPVGGKKGVDKVDEG
jgi:hypothetical protein